VYELSNKLWVDLYTSYFLSSLEAWIEISSVILESEVLPPKS
jgi:hypothetical protein